MKDELGIDEIRGLYRIVWVCEGDLGASLGEGGETLRVLKSKLEKAKGEDREMRAAEIAILEMDEQPDEKGSYGFGWDSLSDAKKALRVANAAIQAERDNRPWPDWAKKAASEGWKPPKGWKP